MKKNNLSLWQKFKARKLDTNVYVMLIFVFLLIISIIVYIAYEDNVLISQLSLAVLTSVMASILFSFFDIYTKYQNYENSVFIENLYKFGIHNLHFDKKEILTQLIDKAKSEIWVSGYRLIMTKDLSKNLMYALRKGVNINFLICPPWEDAYKMVYGTAEGIIGNYSTVFETLLKGTENSPTHGNVEIHFTTTPLFNDTYKIDDKIITSPYMHNKDIMFGVMSANDFFTYELDEKYKLFQIIEEEYRTLWLDCKYGMDLNDFREKIHGKLNNVELNELEKADIFRNAAKEL